jgi:response regulator RpfG family c-di-GMP phosphodiesterase
MTMLDTSQFVDDRVNTAIMNINLAEDYISEAQRECHDPDVVEAFCGVSKIFLHHAEAVLKDLRDNP